MKTTIYIIVVMIFGALVLSPILPKDYPPKEILEQKESIVLQEIKLEHLIRKIEYEIKKDSVEIKYIKKK